MIPFIYNYCDRWCERCTLRNKCHVYLKTSDLSETDLDLRNERFMDVMQEALSEASELLSKKMEEMGIPPLSEDEIVEYEKQEKLKDEELDRNPLLEHAREYNRTMEPVLCFLQEEMKKYTGQSMQLDMEIDNLLPLHECYEVIQWYRYLIEAKLERALSGLYDTELYDDDGFMYDSNGNAKIALISIDRSISAWKSIYNRFPEKEDDILNLLIRLQKIKFLIETVFPDAYRFVRPGFDEQR